MAKEVRTITKAQYLQLVGLNTLAAKYDNLMRELNKAAEEITQEKHDCGGHTMDIIYQSRELDEGLEIMGITVEP